MASCAIDTPAFTKRVSLSIRYDIDRSQGKEVFLSFARDKSALITQMDLSRKSQRAALSSARISTPGYEAGGLIAVLERRDVILSEEA